MDTPDSDPPTATATNNNTQFLRHLNKLSHKISKPTNRPSEPPLHPPPPQQPPVYNISKSDFRDVVQRLTGSPAHAHAHAHAHAPPSLHAPKPNSSRLQRIRPPPLAPLLSCARTSSSSGFGFGSGLPPMSPLPPLPSCHGAAESPISAYMRFLQNPPGIMFPPTENFENLPPPPSPKSPCALLSPKLILPLSPTVPSP